jgi:hypothetical protein
MNKNQVNVAIVFSSGSLGFKESILRLINETNSESRVGFVDRWGRIHLEPRNVSWSTDGEMGGAARIRQAILRIHVCITVDILQDQMFLDPRVNAPKYKYYLALFEI